jgi:hypothetical protein
MFPERFAQHWISEMSAPGDLVLDPFCGRGTTPFQALLQDRRALASDTNAVAYCVTRAKINAPSKARVLRRLAQLRRDYDPTAEAQRTQPLPEFFGFAFAPTTLNQLLYLRRRLRWRTSDTDAFIAALLLGSLHGESDRSAAYLSNRMPRTISTKPQYSIRWWTRYGFEPPERDAFGILRQRVDFRYATPPPTGSGEVFHGDMRGLPTIARRHQRRVKLAVTSPPYLDTTSFEEDQWLRLWFLGGPPRPTIGRVSRDDRHWSATPYWALIADMWRCLGRLMSEDSHVIIRIGTHRSPPHEIVERMEAAASFARRTIALDSWTVSDIVRRQTDAFRPGTHGHRSEVDLVFSVT